jgi:hypothetical protein
MSAKNIDQAVSDGIRRTINRFRENPFYYFTESDIHASLVRDILDGNSVKFYLPTTKDNLRLSMVHLEYPTNFKFARNEALPFIEGTAAEGIKQRGNFDLAVLNEVLLKEIANMNTNTLINFLRSIISKDIAQNEAMYTVLGHPVGKLIDYAIEVKFFHFNNTSQEMFDQVKIDNFKLGEAQKGSASIKPINLIFCYYWRDGNKNHVWENRLNEFRKSICNGNIGIGNSPLTPIPKNVLNIFIEANINPDAIKSTKKPACCYKNDATDLPDWVSLLTYGYEIHHNPVASDNLASTFVV